MPLLRPVEPTPSPPPPHVAPLLVSVLPCFQLPYHNYLHAADVLLGANKLILHLNFENSVPTLDFLALQIACVGELTL